ncbi:hypothetical protein ACFE04_015467 [Oxalis oulophora]
MGTEDNEIDSLESGLLLSRVSSAEDIQNLVDEEEEDPILFHASFEEMEENYVKYQTAQWVLYSLLLILAWGIGFFMLLYLPVRRYVMRKDIRSKKMYLTHNAIVYKVSRPEAFPYLGELKREKHVLLPSIADVVIEQGYLQSLFGVYSLRIENLGVRKPASDDVKILGIANANAFRKAVLTHLASIKNEAYTRQVSLAEDTPNSRIGAWMSPSKSLRSESFSHPADLLLLQKLEEVGSSMKNNIPSPQNSLIEGLSDSGGYVVVMSCDDGNSGRADMAVMWLLPERGRDVGCGCGWRWRGCVVVMVMMMVMVDGGGVGQRVACCDGNNC